MKTIIILDWDDTLFPTTWVIQNNILNIYNFNILDNQLIKLLNILLSLGEIIIVTNAFPNWIQQTLQVLPKTKSLLLKYNIVFRYARLEYNTIDYLYSKIPIFNSIYINNIHYHPLTIISIGDDKYEYIALKNLLKFKNKKKLHFIQIKKQSNCESLIKQIEHICNNINIK